VAATIAGVRQVVFFAQSGLVAVVPETGAVLWRYPFPYSTSTAASPVVGEDVVYCSAAYGAGAGTVRITNSGGQLITNEVWRIPFANPLMNHWATPVLHGGYLFVIYGQQGPTVLLRCIDFASGEQKWNQSGVGTGGGVLFVAGHVLVLTEDGNLLLVKPDPTAYTEVARYRALDGSSNSIPGIVRCWNVPAISNGRIYARSTTEAVCLDVTATPPLKLLSTLTSGTSLFQLLIGNADGSPLDTNRAANIDVFASTDLTLGLSGWIKLNSSTTLTNGRLSLDDPQSPATAQRFFRVEERP